MITIERLNELLDYDRGEGQFRWRVRLGKARTGAIAGCMYPNGYRYIGIDGEVYLAHHLVWFVETGCWPEGGIDHRDTDSTNNRFPNLRPATQTQNLGNARLRSDNTSGFKGVSWDRTRGRWCAKIKNKTLGRFEYIEDAVEAYRLAASEVFGEYARAA